MNKIEVTTTDHYVRVRADECILYKGEIFEYFDEGLTRMVYVNADKTKVIKLLIDKRGHDFNTEEFEIYENASEEKKAKLAHTEICESGFIIEQEFCNPIKLDDRDLTIPQMLFASACRNEVGWNSKGDLVCFDLDEYQKY
jgi:hypothetical protein